MKTIDIISRSEIQQFLANGENQKDGIFMPQVGARREELIYRRSCGEYTYYYKIGIRDLRIWGRHNFTGEEGSFLNSEKVLYRWQLVGFEAACAILDAMDWDGRQDALGMDVPDLLKWDFYGDANNFRKAEQPAPCSERAMPFQHRAAEPTAPAETEPTQEPIAEPEITDNNPSSPTPDAPMPSERNHRFSVLFKHDKVLSFMLGYDMIHLDWLFIICAFVSMTFVALRFKADAAVKMPIIMTVMWTAFLQCSIAKRNEEFLEF